MSTGPEPDSKKLLPGMLSRQQGIKPSKESGNSVKSRDGSSLLAVVVRWKNPLLHKAQVKPVSEDEEEEDDDAAAAAAADVDDDDDDDDDEMLLLLVAAIAVTPRFFSPENTHHAS
jgi:hypothetical protein